MTAVVKAESLTKRFGEGSAVRDLSVALEAGTITGFLFDHPYAELPRAALRIGAVLEATDFHPGRSGRDHLRMLGQAVEVPDSRADEVLRVVELGDAARRRVKGYSLGMRQRLGLAVALLGDPELLILDEPAKSDALMGYGNTIYSRQAPGASAITLIAWARALVVLGIALSVRQDINWLPG